MSVSNLAPLLESCAAHGHKIVAKECELRRGMRIGMVEDPDGNGVEFLAIGN